jgi:protein-tyrosine phosphatase
MCEHDFNWILDDVAVGNVYAGKNLDGLTALGISVIVCALPTLPLPAETYKAKGFSLLHIPVDDSPQVNLFQWFDYVSEFIMAHRLLGRKVLVHCYAGMSRSVSLVAAYLINFFYWDSIRALYWIRDRRPCVSVNSGFLKQLGEYGSKFKPTVKRKQ